MKESIKEMPEHIPKYTIENTKFEKDKDEGEFSGKFDNNYKHFPSKPNITLKCRIGVDDVDSWEEFVHFIETVYEISGVDIIILHARKAYLKGLNPKENRTVPPLKYDWVYRIAKMYPKI